MLTVQSKEVAASASQSKLASVDRLLSVDVFRGLCVSGMILVTNPGSYDFVYAPLRHADWNGWTFTDMIFPSFLFLVGVSMTYSFASRRRREERPIQVRRHIAVRSTGLIVLGLLLTFADLLHVHDFRLPGILQRIGLCIFVGGLIYLALWNKSAPARCIVFLVWAVALVSVYWVLQTQVSVPGFGKGRLDAVGTLSAFVDRAIFGTKHLWHWGGPGQMWDPEGLLTTLPATANLLLGMIAGEWMQSESSKLRRVLALLGIGAVLMVIAFALNPVVPINKKIWTPSFVLLSGGFSLIVMGILDELLDRNRIGANKATRIALTPALIFGSNAILGFSLATIISPVLGVIHFPAEHGKDATVPQLVFLWFSQFFSPWNASLAYATLFVLLIMALVWPLYHRRIFVRL